MKSKIKVSKTALAIFNALEEEGAKVYLVGGCVRDAIMHIPSHDKDVEVFHITYEKLCEVLCRFSPINTFGKQFAIVKVECLPDYDFALPRNELKSGDKHTDFEVCINPDLSIEEAVQRRDFTMNALMYDFKEECIIDQVDGIQDIMHKVIRVVNPIKFQEDPLRILRAASFASRFDMYIDESTQSICASMVKKGMLNHLSEERVYEEYCKILMSSKPSIGFEFLKSINALPKYLSDLVITDQRRDYHPEGSVWNHTMLVVDIAALCKHKSDEPLSFMWSALLHDIGKPSVTTAEGHAHKHNESGLDVFKDISMITSKKQRKYIQTMIMYHMHLMNMARNQSRDIVYKRLLKKIDQKVSLNDLMLITRCDKLGRGLLNKESLESFDNFMNDKISRIGDHALTPIIDGHDLMKDGFEDYENFASLLKMAYEYQLEGLSKEQIMRRLKNESRKHSH